jgi:hypothetical protein
MQYKLGGLLTAMALLLGGVAHAQVLDPGVALTEMSSGFNDGYFSGRGTVFTANSDFTLTGAGLWTNPTGADTYTWNLYQTLGYPVSVSDVFLGTTSVTLTDTGLGYYDATFSSPISLVAGNRYHIEVIYQGIGEQNFFYNFDQGSVNIGDFTVEDGTDSGGSSNSVMPSIRLSGSAAAPEPGTLALLALGGAVEFMRARRRTR